MLNPVGNLIVAIFQLRGREELVDGSRRSMFCIGDSYSHLSRSVNNSVQLACGIYCLTTSMFALALGIPSREIDLGCRPLQIVY